MLTVTNLCTVKKAETYFMQKKIICVELLTKRFIYKLKTIIQKQLRTYQVSFTLLVKLKRI